MVAAAAASIACSAHTGGSGITRDDVTQFGSGGGSSTSSSSAGGIAPGGFETAPQQTSTPPIISTPQPTDSGVMHTCGSVQVPAHVDTVTTTMDVPGNVLFVFDQSGSMNDTWNGSTKIQGAIDAINAAFDPVKDKLSAGAIFFPHVDPMTGQSGCNWATDWLTCLLNLGTTTLCLDVDPISMPPQIPIQAGPTFLTAWNGYWAPPVAAKGGGTPTEKGMLAGEAALATPPPGNTVMVLVTDGAPTCGMNESAPAQRLAAKNIKTYVIGLPGAAGTTVLDQVALAGGTAAAGCTSNCFISPSDSAALQKVFSNIATTVVTSKTVTTIKDCSFQLEPPDSGNPADVHLVVTDTASGSQYEVPQMATNGWTLSADYRTATLTGSICDGAKGGAYSNFSFQYGCVSVPPLPIR
ncbi:MAG TPA: vWA domain-containing protein [Polyangiaceae bacterium]|nr:vWA domain-containing protein [Polyangiaceae bacterium]